MVAAFLPEWWPDSFGIRNQAKTRKSSIAWMIFVLQDGHMYPRHISPLLLESLADTPVVLLNDARQTGKSTLVQSLASPGVCRYLTLDDQAA